MKPPPVTVTAPAVTPHRFGLFSVAEFPPADDPHIDNGVQFEPLAHGPASLTHDACRSAAAALAVAAQGSDVVVGEPFTVYGSYSGSLVGEDFAEIESRARAALALGEQAAAEAAYHQGAEGNLPVLQDAGTTVLAGGLAQPLVAALGELEGELAKVYSGEGVLHLPRHAIPHLFDRRQLLHEGPRLVTHLGNRVAAGAGYSNVSPTGVAAGAGEVWIYATGAVAIWRSEPFVNPTPVTVGFDPTDNSTALIAERTYTVAHDGPVLAVLATL